MELHQHALEINGRHAEFMWKDLNGIGHVEDLGVKGSIILK
jgi:hypothetical protein